ncbi:MAG: amidohydrolase family protein [Planctomycetes bacterium]|nr:amidohydrolase family protein [Planctomycetota bacterium]
MQRLRSLFVPAVLSAWVCCAPGLFAQEPEAPPSPAAGSAEPPPQEPQNAETPEAPRNEGRRRSGGRRRAIVAIQAGTVHPVSGPAIDDGVVLLRGDRIVAVGKQGELPVPDNAVVHSFPTGHVYPGLIDAETDAFADQNLKNDGTLDGGAELADGLTWNGERDDQLVAGGVTTAYIAVRSGARLRGQGAIVRPMKDGFELWQGKEHAAVELRMTEGPGASHPLQRAQQLEQQGNLFDGLDDFRKAQEKYDEELKKYEKDFEAWLDHHKKKSGQPEKPAEGGEAKPAEAPPQQPGPGGPGGEGRRGGRRGTGERPPRPGGGGGEVSQEEFEEALATLMAVMAEAPTTAQDPKPAEPKQEPKPGEGQPNGPAGQKPEEKKDEGPKRPTWPKKPNPDPTKDALLKVVDGDLPLRVEAHRPDELRTALAMQREHEIPLLVLEQAYGADSVAEEIARQGAMVVLTDLLPYSIVPATVTRHPYAGFDPTTLATKLQAAGVPFAIASGKSRLAPLLPMMAAAAIGRGLSEDAALRAITLTPAEILGVAGDTGSLQQGKYADVLVTDGPLFSTDSRVLLVLARGRTEFEAK